MSKSKYTYWPSQTMRPEPGTPAPIVRVAIFSSIESLTSSIVRLCYDYVFSLQAKQDINTCSSRSRKRPTLSCICLVFSYESKDL